MVRVAITILLMVAWHFPTTFFVPQDAPNDHGWLIWPFGKASPRLRRPAGADRPERVVRGHISVRGHGGRRDLLARLRDRHRQPLGDRHPDDVVAAGCDRRCGELDRAVRDLPQPAVHHPAGRRPRGPVGRLHRRLDAAEPDRGVGPRSRPRSTSRAGSVAPVGLELGDIGGRLGPPLEVELGEDRADVVLDRLVGQEDVGRDLLVGLAFGDEGKDLALLLGQRGELVGLVRRRDPAHALQDLAGHRGVLERMRRIATSDQPDELAR